jgi:hypothetical protein
MITILAITITCQIDHHSTLTPKIMGLAKTPIITFQPHQQILQETLSVPKLVTSFLRLKWEGKIH